MFVVVVCFDNQEETFKKHFITKKAYDLNFKELLTSFLYMCRLVSSTHGICIIYSIHTNPPYL